MIRALRLAGADEGGFLAPMSGTRPEPEHQAVLSNLFDLQARLRGDPASLVPPRSRARIGPSKASQPTELVRAAEARVTALRARLDQLEAELQSIAASLPPRDRA
jgi:hypothetical protein